VPDGNSRRYRNDVTERTMYYGDVEMKVLK